MSTKLTAAELKRYRQTQRIFITSLKEYQEFIDTKANNAKVKEISIRLCELKDSYNQFKENQMILVTNDDDEAESNTRNEVDAVYFPIRAALEERIEDPMTAKTGIKYEQLPCVPKLPELSIPIFTGDIKGWMPFIEAFDSHIHRNQRLDDLTRFQYLKNFVGGPAAKVIESLDFIAKNYEEARNLLTERYYNPRIITEDHLRSLIDGKPIERITPQKLLELLDDFNSHLRSLRTLGRPVEHWDDILVYIIQSRFDTETKSKWREWSADKKFVKFSEITNFIRTNSQRMECPRNEDNSTAKTKSKFISDATQRHNLKYSHASFRLRKFFCVLCKVSGHSIFRCQDFLALPVQDRKDRVKQLNICSNCLGQSHTIDKCKVAEVCRICKLKHHSLLHSNDNLKSDVHGSTSSGTSSCNNPESSMKNNLSGLATNKLVQISSSQSSVVANQPIGNQTLASSVSNSNYMFVFLATALVEIRNDDNCYITARALLDSGSQLNFITEEFAARLNIKTTRSNISIRGIGGASMNSTKTTNICLRSRINGFKTELQCFVLEQISDKQPSIQFDVSKWPIPPNIKLAVPAFFESKSIDILIGADTYYELQSVGQIKLGTDLPLLQNTQLGWVVSGKANISFAVPQYAHVASHVQNDQLDHLLERFWCQEVDACDTPDANKEECEKHFQQTYKRNAEGRFMVKLPFSASCDKLGDSSIMARKRFLNLERKLNRNHDTRKAYHQFMTEYIELNHMKVENDVEWPHFYMPHHCVIKASSSTTKLRVVFDASAKTTTGTSLNDILSIGPTVQNELFAIVTRFRAHRYAITADLQKMYRQILVDKDDQKFQYIYWRFNENEPIATYRLKTVTYGTAPASFLSTRCLLQLAIENEQTYPMASDAIKSDMYVDDFLSGANSVRDSIQLRKDVTNIFQGAGMSLRKWCSNNPDLIADVPDIDKEQLVEIDSRNCIKTLGIYWEASEDVSEYK